MKAATEAAANKKKREQILRNHRRKLLGCSASFVHATFVDEIWKTISNLEFRRLDPRKQNFLDFRRSIAALVKTDIFLEISGFFTRNLM